MTLSRRTGLLVLGLASLAFPLNASLAEPGTRGAPAPWHDVKCERYKTAWSHALSRLGAQGLGSDFLAKHQAFLDSGCSAKHDVCPRLDSELRLANVMVVMAMNFGTASTFPPFACPR